MPKYTVYGNRVVKVWEELEYFFEHDNPNLTLEEAKKIIREEMIFPETVSISEELDREATEFTSIERDD